MDVSPMSMQMIVPRATDVSQIQHNMNQAGAMQQDFQALREKDDANLKQKQVRNKENAEGGTVKDDPERRGRQGGYAGSRRQPRQEVEDGPAPELYALDPLRGRSIDIVY